MIHDKTYTLGVFLSKWKGFRSGKSLAIHLMSSAEVGGMAYDVDLGMVDVTYDESTHQIKLCSYSAASNCNASKESTLKIDPYKVIVTGWDFTTEYDLGPTILWIKDDLTVIGGMNGMNSGAVYRSTN